MILRRIEDDALRYLLYHTFWKSKGRSQKSKNDRNEELGARDQVLDSEGSSIKSVAKKQTFGPSCTSRFQAFVLFVLFVDQDFNAEAQRDGL